MAADGVGFRPRSAAGWYGGKRSVMLLHEPRDLLLYCVQAPEMQGEFADGHDHLAELVVVAPQGCRDGLRVAHPAEEGGDVIVHYVPQDGVGQAVAAIGVGGLSYDCPLPWHCYGLVAKIVAIGGCEAGESFGQSLGGGYDGSRPRGVKGDGVAVLPEFL